MSTPTASFPSSSIKTVTLSSPPNSSPSHLNPSISNSTSSISKHPLQSSDPLPLLIARNLHQQRYLFVNQIPTNDGQRATESSLVTQANQAVDRLPHDIRATGPAKVTFLAVDFLRNGAMRFEMKTVEAARWIKQPHVLDCWLEEFPGRKGTAHGQTYTTLAKFVPTRLELNGSPYLKASCIQAATSAYLPEDSIQTMRWIKPTQSRTLNQKHAHLLVSFTEPKYANQAIQQGLILEGRHVEVVKMPQWSRSSKPWLQADKEYSLFVTRDPATHTRSSSG